MADPGADPVDGARWGRLSSIRLSPAAGRQGLGVLMAAATLAMLSWNLSRPALWLDESASILATQRTWPHLLTLLRGTDAPLVPYYLLLKALSGSTLQFFPQLAAHPEVLYRWPSVLAIVLAGWALTVWLARYCPIPVVLCVDVAMLAIGGISRYGQEVRPYPFIVLLAVICTVLWTRVVQDGRRRFIALYAVSIVLLISANSLTASLVAAHLAASVVAVERDKRWSAILRTVIGGAIGAVLVAPIAVNAALHGGGATSFATLTPAHLITAFVKLFSTDKQPFLQVSAVVAWSVLGLAQVFLPRLRFIARVAACWAIVPPIVLLPAVAVKRNLLIGRYLLFTIPGWAILAGLGIVTVAQLVSWVVKGLARQRLPRPARGLPALLGAAAALALIGVMIGSQLPTLQNVRTPGGHGEDLRPALAQADLPQYARLPIYINSWKATVDLAPYSRQDEARLIGRQQQRDTAMIWPTLTAPSLLRRQLRNLQTPLVVFIRSASATCYPTSRPRPTFIQKCLPAVFTSLRFQVLSVHPGGVLWTFGVLSRTAAR